MGKTTGIGWTNSTWNPWRGCKKISPGCARCYMYRDQKRYGHDPREIVRTSPQTFNAPLSWKDPALVFTCSWSDWFIEQADEWRTEAWDIIRHTPHLTYQILTKRPESIEERLPQDWWTKNYPNVWLGVSVESHEYLWRAEELSLIPAVVRFISYEPALGPVDFSPILGSFDWLIAGGESGPNCRLPNPDWFIDVRNQCAKAGVRFFFKQWGGKKKIDGTWGGDVLDGKVYHDIPPHLVGTI